MMLSFEEKITMLATIRAIGFTKSVNLFSKMKRHPPVATREVLDKLDSTHYLCDEGVVEKTSHGTVQYTKLSCPQQPIPLTKEFFDSCKEYLQNEFSDALTLLKCKDLLKTFKPLPIVRKMKYEQANKDLPAS